MARPTTGPYGWATAVGRRGSVTSGDQAQGNVAGTPVPSLKLNELWGNMSDWLLFFASSLLTYSTEDTIRLNAVTGPWQPVASNAIMSVQTDGAQLNSNDAFPAFAVRGWGPVTMGGEITGGTVTITNEVGNDYLIGVTVFGYDATGTPAQSEWGYSGTAPGTFPLVYGSGATEIYGPMEIGVTMRAPATGQVRLQTVTIALGAP